MYLANLAKPFWGNKMEAMMFPALLQLTTFARLAALQTYAH